VFNQNCRPLGSNGLAATTFILRQMTDQERGKQLARADELMQMMGTTHFCALNEPLVEQMEGGSHAGLAVAVENRGGEPIGSRRAGNGRWKR
jgi:hypothetical protein